MTNEELQEAIDSLLDFLKPPTSSYVTATLEHLLTLYAEQKKRSMIVTEIWK